MSSFPDVIIILYFFKPDFYYLVFLFWFIVCKNINKKTNINKEYKKQRCNTNYTKKNFKHDFIILAQI